MTERERLYHGMSCAAWSYLFLFVDFRLGSFNLLPNFVGYWLLLRAIAALGTERRDLALLRPFAWILLGWNLADCGLQLAGGRLSGWFPPAELLIGMMVLYFHFQFFTDCAALAAAHQLPEETLDRALLRGRTVQAVVHTAVFLLNDAAVQFGGVWQWVQTGMAVVYVIAGFSLMRLLFRLRALFREEPAQQAS